MSFFFLHFKFSLISKLYSHKLCALNMHHYDAPLAVPSNMKMEYEDGGNLSHVLNTSNMCA